MLSRFERFICKSCLVIKLLSPDICPLTSYFLVLLLFIRSYFTPLIPYPLMFTPFSVCPILAKGVPDPERGLIAQAEFNGRVKDVEVDLLTGNKKPPSQEVDNNRVV